MTVALPFWALPEDTGGHWVSQAPDGKERAMEIGRPVRVHIVEPLEDPVPRESPTEPVPEPPREAPDAAPTP